MAASTALPPARRMSSATFAAYLSGMATAACDTLSAALAVVENIDKNKIEMQR